METLLNLFSHVCGQQIDHTWLPGGIPLPVCQRCTGLYIGAALALGLLLGFRPRLTGWFLGVHGLFLVGMAPFGLHWIDHGPAVRAITGLGFGAAVVVFLALWPLEFFHTRFQPRRTRIPSAAEGMASPGTVGSGRRHRPGARRYLIALSVAAAVLPLVCQSDRSSAAYLIMVGIVAGALSFACLLLLNALALAWWLGRTARRLTDRPSSPTTADHNHQQPIQCPINPAHPKRRRWASIRWGDWLDALSPNGAKVTQGRLTTSARDCAERVESARALAPLCVGRHRSPGSESADQADACLRPRLWQADARSASRPHRRGESPRPP